MGRVPEGVAPHSVHWLPLKAFMFPKYSIFALRSSPTQYWVLDLGLLEMLGGHANTEFYPSFGFC